VTGLSVETGDGLAIVCVETVALGEELAGSLKNALSLP